MIYNIKSEANSLFCIHFLIHFLGLETFSQVVYQNESGSVRFFIELFIDNLKIDIYSVIFFNQLCLI